MYQSGNKHKTYEHRVTNGFADVSIGKHNIEILKFFDQLHKAGNTIIVVTHEKSIAKRAKRRVELFDGKITLDE